MELIKNFRYRPEIDGLRTVAVLAVVFFHAGLGCPGGYIGVDVFFVISGFLITSLILKDLQQERFTILQFWERRIRRIVPALFVVVLVVLGAGWILLLPSDYASLAKSAVWQSLFSANFYFGLNTGYFAGPADEMPLLHLWSLAVEEQFYLIFPLVLLCTFRWTVFRSRRALLVIFGAGILFSFLLSIYRVQEHPSGTFFLLPTRAWELLCGALVAVWSPLWIPGSRLVRSLLSWVGLAMIILPCFLYDKNTLFPGLAALPPCLGSCLFILATGRPRKEGVVHPMPFPGRFLSLRPVVFIGLISYSLYLWHWPLFAFGNYWQLGVFWAQDELPLIVRFTMVGASVLLAIISWRFV